MAKSVGDILLLAVVLSFTWAAEQSYFGDEHERRWNTPPELTPESVRSFVLAGGDQEWSFSLTGVTRVQQPNRPTWNNVSPNYNERHSGRPTLTITKPHIKVPTLNIEAHDASCREQAPTIRVYEWRSDHKLTSRPSLSIEYSERQ